MAEQKKKTKESRKWITSSLFFTVSRTKNNIKKRPKLSLFSLSCDDYGSSALLSLSSRVTRPSGSLKLSTREQSIGAPRFCETKMAHPSAATWKEEKKERSIRVDDAESSLPKWNRWKYHPKEIENSPMLNSFLALTLNVMRAARSA